MRAYPLVLCPDAAADDCHTTNPAPICVAWTRLYIYLLIQVLSEKPETYDPAHVDARVQSYARTLAEGLEDPETFLSAVSQADLPPDVSGQNNGWSRHAMHLAYLSAVLAADGLRLA